MTKSVTRRQMRIKTTHQARKTDGKMMTITRTQIRTRKRKRVVESSQRMIEKAKTRD